MDEQERMAERFEQSRRHLVAVAYRMLGSLSEAEDAVQETWLRYSRMNQSAVYNVEGWLTTVVSRICLDMLRTRRSRHEEPMEEFMRMAHDEHSGGNPEQEALLADSVGAALQIVLGKLGPSERVAFVLHDIFALPFADIAAALGKSEEAVRQIASRARRRIRGGETGDEPRLARQREMVEAFLAAARDADFGRLLAVLAPDVILRDDRQAGAVRTTQGAEQLAKQVAGRIQASHIVLVNGAIGVIVAPQGKLQYVLQYTIRDGRIAEVELISDPARISRLDLALPDI
ncbi:sigma-70 family RNA polymerase sigma factor [Paenibacillus sp. YN15]|uniref:sigma-70 family RNA polymerase sigma factor n=1 Tax=Paenibacillus sp. YN15 TaxID=1742774 RepID=UPI000DCCE21D|nr:sigma-70 family RNA polymerase sigma factor [Paenibacillus sp. YN15]RAV00229.1 RNA polymerase subunit sigma-70 [Paenibacillus sp. YN15]